MGDPFSHNLDVHTIGLVSKDFPRVSVRNAQVRSPESESSDIHPGNGQGRGRLRPLYLQQCREGDPAPYATGGPTGMQDSADPDTPDPRHLEFLNRLRDSYRRAGINHAIAIFHGSLFARARQKAETMSFQTWQEVQASGDESTAKRIFSHVIESTIDSMRDQILQGMLGQTLVHLIGSPITYLNGLSMVYEDHRWNSPDQHRRLDYRTQQVYAWLLGVVATNAANNNSRLAVSINQQLVQQGLNYMRWKSEYYPSLQRWVRRTFTATERGPQIHQAY